MLDLCSLIVFRFLSFFFFFFNDTATTEIYTLSLHDALPISVTVQHRQLGALARIAHRDPGQEPVALRLGQGIGALHFDGDRKSTRLNSSHSQISYAVFCLKKKNKKKYKTNKLQL